MAPQCEPTTFPAASETVLRGSDPSSALSVTCGNGSKRGAWGAPEHLSTPTCSPPGSTVPVRRASIGRKTGLPPLRRRLSAWTALRRALALLEDVDDPGPEPIDGSGTSAWSVRERGTVGERDDEVPTATAHRTLVQRRRQRVRDVPSDEGKR